MNRGGRRAASKTVPVEPPEEALQELGEDGEIQDMRDVDVEPESREPTIADLTGLFQAHMAKMDAREAQRNAEYVQQERRFKALQHQFGLLQLEVQARTTPTPNPLLTARDTLEGPDEEDAVSSRPLSQSTACRKDMSEVRDPGQCQFKEPKLEKLSDSDNVEHFLITFERIAAACRWPKEDWAFHLIPLLTGKARAAYVHMDVDDSLDYEELKSAILRKYDISRETYRQRFRSLDVESFESPKELYVRLKELYVKWMQPKSKSVEDIGEVIILEQYLRMLSSELQVWVREHDPKSALQAANLADVFVAARKGNQPWCWKSSRDDRRLNLPQQSSRHFTSTGKPPGGGPAFVTAAKSHRKVPVCYLCGQEGHTKPMCPKNVVKTTHLCYVPRGQICPPAEAKESPLMTTVELNGRQLAALIDTGSDQTLVHSKYIPLALLSYTDKKVVRCVHGDEKLLPTAEVYLKVRGQTYLLEVAVADNLPFPVVLGHDLPVLRDLLQLVPTCNMVVTRARASRGEESEPLLATLPFFNEDVELCVSAKSRKSRRQKRLGKIKYNASNMPTESFPDFSPEFKLPANIIQLQQEDASLKPYLERAKQEDSITAVGDGKETYCIQQGILYRQLGPVTQLVVPQCVREVVLTLGHSIPWAGHLGKRKTIARIRKYFYWPGLNAEVAQYCRSCPECQKVSIQSPCRVPLQPLPIIGTPFERLGMDVIGPVERSRSGNRFMLVVTDYATRYPEVFSLKSIKAKYVATCLMQLFSRVGFPSEILTDQGTNFMSTLLKQVYKLLGIKSLRTTPFHPQTDGLTERFNQTLKQMLRKFVCDSGTDWDQWLPYLLFAYREVPQSSIGFSPFELLYGHEVRGPLALLREIWEGDQRRGEAINIVSYVVQMRERLEKMTALAQVHLKEAQTHQKTWYDQSARERRFEPGQKVLVMLPSHESKLMAKWQGPYEVKRKLGPTTYEIAMSNHDRPTRILHINLLKQWVPRFNKTAHSLMIKQVKEEEESDDQFLPQPALGDVDLSHLSPQQQREVRDLCLPGVFSEYPGFTTLIEHDIVLKPDAVVRRMSYRVPERLQESLKKEVELMLRLGIIEPSNNDTVIYSDTWEQHMQHVLEVLQRLQEAGLNVNPRKCAIAKAETEYLGFVIGKGVIRSQEPQSTPVDERSILQTDASDRGLGAVLLQEGPDARRPIAFLSRKLFPREVRYSIVEKECLAVKWALDSLKYYLLGREFILETDHKALQWLQRMKDTNSRITRWYLAMQPYRFSIQHVPGKENLTADYLSRCASDIPEGREYVMARDVATHP
ncbi:hypothetical protein QQF64_016335 [Cirrhinus molitorella]|uniref:Gypsy retrotransposon integrase-like protein 1 n=1 Tax=Cirrhinus molitorella TaxID=172907 RepID=A0ABR3LMI0_9TELE